MKALRKAHQSTLDILLPPAGATPAPPCYYCPVACLLRHPFPTPPSLVLLVAASGGSRRCRCCGRTRHLLLLVRVARVLLAWPQQFSHEVIFLCKYVACVRNGRRHRKRVISTSTHL